MRHLSATWWLASLVWSAGCSSDDRPPQGSAGMGGGTMMGGGESQQGGFLLGEDGLPGAPGAEQQGSQCLGETREAEAIGLDIYVMLDISASMLEQLPQTSLFQAPPTKWEAVKQSLEFFVQAPESADIGVGLQYFPQAREGVPESCTSNDDCGAGGPCTSSACVVRVVDQNPTTGLPMPFITIAGDALCSGDAECPGAGEVCRSMLGVCVLPGLGIPPVSSVPLCNAQADCAGIPGTRCETVGACTGVLQNDLQLCTASLGCAPGSGDCVPFPYACVNQTSCEVSDYSVPAVAISSAPSRAADIVSSLEAQVPDGLTPTGPALSGALDHARLWADQNPGRQVVTVLATDGLPTECTPLELPGIAQLAIDANGGPRPVRTFVIGVFSTGDLGANGRDSLDTLARAGGTDRAFVIDTGGDVGDDFLEALNAIRDSAVNCEFQLDAGAQLDFERVNLRVTDASGASSELLNVGDLSACGADQGWYYVRSGTGTPTQIKVCPNTCTGFMAGGVRAELEIGCATRIR